MEPPLVNVSVMMALVLLTLLQCYAQSSYEERIKRLYAPVDYAVLGQQKSGTSTLWMNLKAHPDLTWVSHQKETLWFNTDIPRATFCDNDLEGYQEAAAYMRIVRNRTDLVVGDWSATHFSCICCPIVFKSMNPKIKLIVILRDPVQRTVSRFIEQQSLTFGPYHRQVVNQTFKGYVDQELGKLQACLITAARYRQPSQQADGSKLRGWGAGMDLARWMESQCFARSNIIGWSAYDVFLENYMAHFPQEQLLVLYTEDLATGPLEVVRRVERFLGLAPAKYNNDTLLTVFNSRDCYDWQCGKRQPKAGLEGMEEEIRNGSVAMAIRRLSAFFRPHVQRLLAWADEGHIPPAPAAWRRMYGKQSARR